MLPYPSGVLHMGHVRLYAIGDALARYMWMRGYNVLHPMGWDAFGLPAENAAIKEGKDPHEWTLRNIASMKRQMYRLGFSFDWAREVATCEPEFYRWNQWFFLKMFDRGLAYRTEALLNWCPECGTVLANEQVVDGCCWRHETTPVEQRAMPQWFLKTTAYTPELLADLKLLESAKGADARRQTANEPAGHLGGAPDTAPVLRESFDWPERVLVMQRNWMGRSEGAEIDFAVDQRAENIRVFTTRIDTIYGATALILAPEHRLVAQLVTDENLRLRIKEMIDATARQDPGNIHKVGLFTGSYAIRPFDQARIPVWIGNFVLLGYGAGAIMAVPAHDQRDFEFCRAYGIPVVPVIRPVDGPLADGASMQEAFGEDGIVENSGPWSGLPSEEARSQMTAFAAAHGFGSHAITYRMKDWGISRQRYWGTPIPMIYCPDCGIVPVPEEDLPVLLPLGVKITGEGRSPLEFVEDFINVKCPKCGAPARRESDTMDTFVDSSWYFFRYCDPRNDKAPFDSAKIAYWFPIDQYIGGVEHAILHLIYMRYWTKFMRDLGLVSIGEPVKRMFTQGMVIKDGAKMSKSHGNVVSPDDMVAKFGADSARMYSLFAAPPDRDLDWQEEGVSGVNRFLGRVYRFVTRNANCADAPSSGQSDRDALRKLHRTLQKITIELDTRWHFNTSIAALMELLNDLYASEAGLSCPVRRELAEKLTLMLAPFAPYLAQDLWETLGRSGPIFRENWPAFDPELAKEDLAEIPVQVNGKLRAHIHTPFGTSKDELQRLALANDKVKQFSDGKQIAKVIVVPDRLVNVVVK
jgi:leucyl-tRNA synthetase